MPLNFSPTFIEYSPAELGLSAKSLQDTTDHDALAELQLAGSSELFFAMVLTAVGAAATLGRVALNATLLDYAGVQISLPIPLFTLDLRSAAGTYYVNLAVGGGRVPFLSAAPAGGTLTIGPAVELLRAAAKIKLQLENVTAHNQATSLVASVWVRASR